MRGSTRGKWAWRSGFTWGRIDVSPGILRAIGGEISNTAMETQATNIKQANQAADQESTTDTKGAAAHMCWELQLNKPFQARWEKQANNEVQKTPCMQYNQGKSLSGRNAMEHP